MTEAPMPERTTAEKPQIKAGQRVAAIDPPTDYHSLVAGLPPGTTVVSDPAGADVVHLFVVTQADLVRRWPDIVDAARTASIVWISYPKRGPGVSTDLTRDSGWRPLRDAGWDPVSQVAIDDRWSALRWRQDPDLRRRREERGARVGRD
ncbi:MAG TPA: hypothetical protein VE817_07220 [Candidatus Acidoferrum sp.]|nr:hypothetical protein [Candidatus Acidoferrum sp.]